jgi:hypothetical protein
MISIDLLLVTRLAKDEGGRMKAEKLHLPSFILHPFAIGSGA